jgi:glyoxylase I family protein
MIRGIHHIALHTADLPRIVEFYRDVVGFQEVARYGWENSEITDRVVGLSKSAAHVVMLRAGNCYLEIFKYAAPEPRPAAPLRACDHGYTHLCLDVTDIHGEYQRLVAAGMTFNTPPGDFGDIRAAYGRDPDGNIVEIQETLPGQAFAMSRLGPPRFD